MTSVLFCKLMIIFGVFLVTAFSPRIIAYIFWKKNVPASQVHTVAIGYSLIAAGFLFL